MSKTSTRPKRKVTIRSDAPLQPPRKWNEDEMETLLSCIMQYGHKNLKKIQEHVPNRSIDNIKRFMRTIHDTAGGMRERNEVLDIWMNKCDALERPPWKDCLQIPQVLKYLSVDGMLENHPLPERCQGIDFRQAYRLLYEAMLGYPIQPVNKPTAEFVLEALAELGGEIKKQFDAVKNLDLFLQNKSTKQESNPVAIADPVTDQTNTNNALGVKKPIKVYQRKRPAAKPEVSPSLKIVVQESQSKDSSASDFKDFSVTLEGKDGSQSTTVNVPVVIDNTFNEEEQMLFKSPSYNPFNIPEKCLKEPLYVNLIKNL